MEDTNALLLEMIRKQDERHQQQMKQQQEQIDLQREQMTKLLTLVTSRGTVEGESETMVTVVGNAKLMAELNGRLSEFHFDAEYEQTFSRWYERYGDIFTIEGAALSHSEKVRLLIGKMGEHVYDRYKRRSVQKILPKTPSDIGFDSTVKMLKDMFDVRSSIFTTRYHCLKVEKSPSEDYMEYTGRVNEQCEKAKIHELDSDGLKALVWIYGLKSTRENDVRQRLLVYLDSMHNEKKTVTLHDLYKECERFISLKRDAKLIENETVSVHEVKTRNEDVRSDRSPEDSPLCWNCGRNGHTSATCRSRPWICGKCNERGHKQEFCERVTKFKTRSRKGGARVNNSVVVETTERSAKVNVVRRYLPVEVNGEEVDFQLDTGSDIILLGVDAWEKMESPKLEKSTIQVMNASGGTMSVHGRLKCDFKMKDEFGTGYAYVSGTKNLVGLDWLTENGSMSYYLEMLKNGGKGDYLGLNAKSNFEHSSCSVVQEKKGSVTQVQVAAINDLSKREHESCSVVEEKTRNVNVIEAERSNQSEVLAKTPIDHENIVVDVVGPSDGISYLVLEDGKRNPELSLLTDIRSGSVVRALNEAPQRGYVEGKTVVTDRSSQFMSKTFGDGCVKLGLKHDCSIGTDHDTRFAKDLKTHLMGRKEMPDDAELLELCEAYHKNNWCENSPIVPHKKSSTKSPTNRRC